MKIKEKKSQKSNLKIKIIACLVLITLIMSIILANTKVEASPTLTRTGGSKVTTIAKGISTKTSITGDYTASSNDVKRTNVAIYEYQTTTPKTTKNIYSFESGTGNKASREWDGDLYSEDTGFDDANIKHDGSVAYKFVRKNVTTDGVAHDFLFYSFPVENGTLSKVATVVYKGGLTWRGKKYDVRIDINSITATLPNMSSDIEKTGSEPVVNILRGMRNATTSNYYTDSTYNLAVPPQIGVDFIAMNKEYSNGQIVQVDASYYAVNPTSGEATEFSSVAKIADVDTNQGVFLDNFKASKTNTFYTDGNWTGTENGIDFINYKTVNNGTYFFDNRGTVKNGDTTHGDIWALISKDENLNSKKALDMSYTFQWKSAYSSIRMTTAGSELEIVHKVTATVENGKIVVNNTDKNSYQYDNISDGGSQKVEFKPDSGYQLKEIYVADEPINKTKMNPIDLSTLSKLTEYEFKNILNDKWIHIVYEPIPEVETPVYASLYGRCWLPETGWTQLKKFGSDYEGSIGENVTCDSKYFSQETIDRLNNAYSGYYKSNEINPPALTAANTKKNPAQVIIEFKPPVYKIHHKKQVAANSTEYEDVTTAEGNTDYNKTYYGKIGQNVNATALTSLSGYKVNKTKSQTALSGQKLTASNTDSNPLELYVYYDINEDADYEVWFYTQNRNGDFDEDKITAKKMITGTTTDGNVVDGGNIPGYGYAMGYYGRKS